MSCRKIGLVMAASALLSGCYRDSDDFNAKAADYVCRYNDGDPAEPFLDRTEQVQTSGDLEFEPYSGPDCEEAVKANLSACSNRCEYSPRKARRCLRKLKRGLRSESYNDGDYAVCDRVYDCEDAVSLDVSAQCHITTQNCAVGDQRPPVVFFALGLLGLWLRRRRS